MWSKALHQNLGCPEGLPSSFVADLEAREPISKKKLIDSFAYHDGNHSSLLSRVLSDETHPTAEVVVMNFVPVTYDV